MRITEQNFHKLAHAALSVMEKLSANPKASRFLQPLDKIVNGATDAIAESVLDGRIQNSGERYGKLHTQYRQVLGSLEEGWIMFPALGLSNNFAGSGAMPDAGVEPWGVTMLDGNDGGKASTLGPSDPQGGINADIEGMVKKGESFDAIAKKILG